MDEWSIIFGGAISKIKRDPVKHRCMAGKFKNTAKDVFLQWKLHIGTEEFCYPS